MRFRTRLSVESLELRWNPSAPGSDAPYSVPGPPPVDTAPVAPAPNDPAPPAGGGSSLPGSTGPYTMPSG